MFALTTANALQVLLSAYTLYLCNEAIRAARTYEQPTERAAQYSSTAAEQLQRTRKTLLSSTGAVTLTFMTSFAPLLGLDIVPGLGLLPSLPLVAIIALVAARRHNEEFWAEKPRVPGIKEWNGLVRLTTEIRVWMRYLVVVAGLQTALGTWTNMRTATS